MTASSLPTRMGSAAKCASVVVCATTSGAPNIALQQALQLRVRRAGDVGARRRELHAVARDRVARRVLEAQVGLQAQVRARSEVHLPAPAQRHAAAAELVVLGDQMAEAARDGVAASRRRPTAAARSICPVVRRCHRLVSAPIAGQPVNHELASSAISMAETNCWSTHVTRTTVLQARPRIATKCRAFARWASSAELVCYCSNGCAAPAHGQIDDEARSVSRLAVDRDPPAVASTISLTT